MSGARPALAGGFDPKIAGRKALEFALLGLAGEVLANPTGLTEWLVGLLVSLLPEQQAALAPIVRTLAPIAIGAALRAIDNWRKNREK